VDALQYAAERLRRAGAVVTVLDLPAEFATLGGMQRVVMHSDGRAAFLNLSRTHPHLCKHSPSTAVLMTADWRGAQAAR